MRTTLKVAGLGLAVALLGSPWSGAAEDAKTTSTHPPKTLKKVGDHWTPWDPPQAAAGSYLIQQHDTLWDLAGKWLGDPHLWPQVWDQNRYVLDSHWIYPGDPLAVPAKPNVVPPEGPPATSQATPPPAEPPPTDAGAFIGQPEAPPAAPVTTYTPSLIQLADRHDLYCSGWVDHEHHPSTLIVQRAEFEKTMMGDGDVLYLNQGKNQGIQAGAEYLVVRPDHNVVHPATHERMGVYMQRMGHIRVLCTQDNTATGIIVGTCENVLPGDELLPWKDLPSPTLDHVPSADGCQAPSGLAQGWIVDGGADELITVGPGDVVATDLGEASGARPGSVLTLFRDNGELPRMVLGQGVVLTVEGPTSTVKVLHTSREVRRGDRAEILQQ